MTFVLDWLYQLVLAGVKYLVAYYSHNSWYIVLESNTENEMKLFFEYLLDRNIFPRDKWVNDLYGTEN